MMSKPVVMTPDQWLTILYRIKQREKPSVYLSRTKMKDTLGFTVRDHREYVKDPDYVKLPSTGGVRLFTYHDGTLYCATDGFISSKLSENPDDRQGKIFYYDSNSETWFLEDVPFDRKKIFDNAGNYDILGIVRPLTSLSYKGRLFLSGHYGSIKTV